jgi:hypothetical protein
MKNVKLLLIFLIVGLSSNAQDNQKRIYIKDNQSMVLILNNEIIGSIDLLKSIPSNQIQELNIYREEKLSSKENLFYNNDKGGIMVAKTKFDIETKVQKDLNEFFGLNADTDLYVNGFLLENKNYKIASNSIAKIEIIEPDNLFLDRRVLNISIK